MREKLQKKWKNYSLERLLKNKIILDNEPKKPTQALDNSDDKDTETCEKISMFDYL